MKLEMLKQKEIPLLSRKRVSFSATYEGKTPQRNELLKQVATMMKVPENLVIIKHIYTQFGQNTVKIIAHVYKNDEELVRFEEKHLIKKHRGGEEKKEKKKEAKK
ncbi:hypothetical protein HZB01_04290 [Candidatus Woesearchaeota archaeon]|nr:hypothetical protein [Candidatus Woesearchaeota archaeon]